VRLPKGYRFSGSEEVVKYLAMECCYGVLLQPIDAPWQILEADLADFESGFLFTGGQPDVRIRARSSHDLARHKHLHLQHQRKALSRPSALKEIQHR